MTLVGFLASLGLRLTEKQKAACRGFEEGLIRRIPPAPRSSRKLVEETKVLVCSVCRTVACAQGDAYCAGAAGGEAIFVDESAART